MVVTTSERVICFMLGVVCMTLGVHMYTSISLKWQLTYGKTPARQL